MLARMLIFFLTLTLPLWGEPRFVLLPLDNRPCNVLFVRQIARIAQAQVITPPDHWLGSWLNPGQCERFADWLQEKPKAGDTLLISSDMLCYGGLVASRNATTSQAVALERLQVLEALHQRGFHIQVLAIIPRLYLRTSEGQAPYETALANWAARADSADSKWPSQVPPQWVKEYLEVRSRNREVIGHLIEATARGFVDKLVIGQDDSSARGLHFADHQFIEQRLEQTQLGDRVMLLSGADELTMDMVTGRLAEVSGLRPRVSLEYSEAGSERRIPPLESHPLETMVLQHLQLSGAVVEENSPLRLFVQVPSDQPFELPSPDKRPRSYQFVERVREWMVRGGKAAVADLAFINRMDPYLAEAVIERIPLTDLEGFAAWNTPANAFGTVSAHLVARHIAQSQAPKWPIAQVLESQRSHLAFILARFIDDYGYQTIVRSEVYPEAQGLPVRLDPLNSPMIGLGRRVRIRLIAWAQDLYHRRFQNRPIQLPGGRGGARLGEANLEVVLPWPRLFEVQVRLDLELLPLEKSR